MEKEYIERAELDDFKDELMNRFIVLCSGNDYNKLNLLTIGNVIDELYEKHSTKPAADVVEVRHGRFVDWDGNPIESFDYCGRACDTWGRALYRPIHCSECHICLAGMNGKLYPHQRKYCPDCGAKMDGGNKDG